VIQGKDYKVGLFKQKLIINSNKFKIFQTGLTGPPWRDMTSYKVYLSFYGHCITKTIILFPGLGQGWTGYFLPFLMKGKNNYPFTLSSGKSEK
jgi:hypothetical protein